MARAMCAIIWLLRRRITSSRLRSQDIWEPQRRAWIDELKPVLHRGLGGASEMTFVTLAWRDTPYIPRLPASSSAFPLHRRVKIPLS